MSNWDYHREERARTQEGDHRVTIINAEETISKTSGNKMIVVTVRPNNSDININYYLVKNQYFNRNMTAFFDSFDIPDGDFNFLSWKGAMGAAKLVNDEDGYLKVRWFINKEKARQLPQWQGEIPERNVVSTLEKSDKIDEGFPWED